MKIMIFLSEILEKCLKLVEILANGGRNKRLLGVLNGVLAYSVLTGLTGCNKRLGRINRGRIKRILLYRYGY